MRPYLDSGIVDALNNDLCNFLFCHGCNEQRMTLSKKKKVSDEVK